MVVEEATEALRSLLTSLLTDREAVESYIQDPSGTLTEYGLSEADLSGIDMRALVGEVCGAVELPAQAASTLDSFVQGELDTPSDSDTPSSTPSSDGPSSDGPSSDGPSSDGPSSGPTPPPSSPPASQPPIETVYEHINYVTYVTYEGDEVIQQQITNIDNSQDFNLDVAGDLDGDVEITTTNVNATGDGAVAAGGDVDNAATGDSAVVVDGDNYGGIASGDGAVAAGDDINAPVNTGENTGIIADGDVENAVVGDNNQAANIDGDAENSVINFGDGDVTNFGDADIDDAAVAIGGDATNVSDNEADDGSAIGAGNAAGANVETDVDIDDSFNQETDVDAYESVVNTEQGAGEQDAHTDESLNDDADFDVH